MTLGKSTLYPAHNPNITLGKDWCQWFFWKRCHEWCEKIHSKIKIHQALVHLSVVGIREVEPHDKIW